MVKIVIRTLSELKAFNQKLKALSPTIPTLQKKALERAADEAVLTSIHTDMETNKFSKKIIDKTFVGDIEQTPKGAKVHFISDFESDSGFDVSQGREEGTFHPNPTFPIKGKSLSWIDKQSGKRIFRKKSHPSGIKRLLIIETNINKNEQAFRDSYEKQIADSLNQLVSG